jgi:hypothetical protein
MLTSCPWPVCPIAVYAKSLRISMRSSAPFQQDRLNHRVGILRPTAQSHPALGDWWLQFNGSSEFLIVGMRMIVGTRVVPILFSIPVLSNESGLMSFLEEMDGDKHLYRSSGLSAQ